MIASQCRAARALLNWSQQDLCNASGIGLAAIRQFENGEDLVRSTTWKALMAALEKGGVRFLAGQGDGPGVRFRASMSADNEMLAFLRHYEHVSLSQLSRKIQDGYSFGYTLFFDRKTTSAKLRFGDEVLGTVTYQNGDLKFVPPISGQPSIFDVNVFDNWVRAAEAQTFADKSG